MKKMKWIGLAAAVLMFIAAFLPWVFIESKNITVTGLESKGTNFGKPAYFHFLLTSVFIILSLTPKIWAKRLNLFIAALNTGWALKNFFFLATCSGGECPVRKAGLWLMLLSVIVMLISSFFPDLKVKDNRRPE